MRTLYDLGFPGLPRRCSQHQPFISLLSLPGERRFPPAPLPEHFLSHRQELTFVGQLRDVPNTLQGSVLFRKGAAAVVPSRPSPGIGVLRLLLNFNFRDLGGGVH